MGVAWCGVQAALAFTLRELRVWWPHDSWVEEGNWPHKGWGKKRMGSETKLSWDGGSFHSVSLWASDAGFLGLRFPIYINGEETKSLRRRATALGSTHVSVPRGELFWLRAR